MTRYEDVIYEARKTLAFYDADPSPRYGEVSLAVALRALLEAFEKEIERGKA